MNIIDKQACPLCKKKTLTLTEDEMDVPYFGKTFIFSMNCTTCQYYKADIEAEQLKDPSRYTFEVSKAADMNIRVVKSSEATVKIPALKMSMEPGPSSEGFVTNIEGILQRFKKIIETERDTAEDEDQKKAAKNLLKKLWKVECGDTPVKIIIEDPSGNSAIISEKAVIEKLKKK